MLLWYKKNNTLRDVLSCGALWCGPKPIFFILIWMFHPVLVLTYLLSVLWTGQVQKIYENERRLHAGDHPVELLAWDFEKNYNMYIYPVHWQFAQMDQHPSDRCVFLCRAKLICTQQSFSCLPLAWKYVFWNVFFSFSITRSTRLMVYMSRFLSHSELAPLRAPLVPMEHCTSVFFHECDADKDKLLSFREWCECFGIKDGKTHQRPK